MTAFKLVVSIGILLTGLACAWFYLRRPTSRTSRIANPFTGERPWRRVGSAVCLLLSVMFVAGVYVVDIPDRPVPYAIYWIIMLGMVVWLFTLAVRDVMYTRKLVDHWRQDLAAGTGEVHRRTAEIAENKRP